MNVITSIEQVTPAWLTTTLEQAGILSRGIVIAVEHEANAAFNSAITHLHLRYSPDAPAQAPRRLLIKRSIDSQWGKDSGAVETAFYRLVADTKADLPMLVPCYNVAYDAASGNSHILLLDISETHAAPVTRAQLIGGDGVPTEAQLNGIIEAIARFHACWWEHPLLGKPTEQGVTDVAWWYSDREHFDRHVERRRGDWTRFIADEGSWFPADLRAIYERTLLNLPLLWERVIGPRVTTLHNLTLCHGDCYLSQFLSPRLPDETAQTYLVDFQDIGANFCAYDLVHLFGIFWTREQRQENNREERMLRQYHAALQKYGVNGYTWDDLLTDYRMTLIIIALYTVWDQTSGANRDYWWPKMQRVIDNFQDHHCMDLLI